MTQQTFLSALENLNGFRGEASFSTWLLRIASHAALKVIRKRKGLDTTSLEEATEETDNYGTIPYCPKTRVKEILTRLLGNSSGAIHLAVCDS